MNRGKFLVMYGSNNSGKSAQVDLMSDWLKEQGKEVVTLKYPIYATETGKLINSALREGADISNSDLQWIFAEDRSYYEPTLVEMLDSGLWVLSEDYVVTGLAWGLTMGVDREFLNKVNKGLLVPDWSMLIDNENRFTSGIEHHHRHEGAGDETWERNRLIHLDLAREFGLEVINRTGFEAEATHKMIVDRFLESGVL